MIDTLRADHLGLYGYERPTSPALDRWAARGAIFERAQATSPWTLPSFGSLWTGMLPSRHAAGLVLDRDPAADASERFAFLDGSARPVGEILAEAGFATAAIVNNPFLHPGFGLARGFETWAYVFQDYARSPRASQIVHWGLQWLDERDSRPFLLVLHVFDPHLSYDARPPARGRFTGELEGGFELPYTAFGLHTPGWRAPAPAEQRFIAAAYDEELAFVDAQLERLFAGLEERGLLEDTLVVLTSDHGEELFDHGGFEHGHSMYQELLRIPLVVWGPGVDPRRIGTPVSLVDLLPTVLDALGVESGEGLAGQSLWPLLRGGAGPDARPLVAEGALHGPDRKSLVRWPWKLVLTAGGGVALYDLERDPGERRDLAAREPARTEELRRELAELAGAASRRRLEALPADVDPATREQLEKLGYLD